MIIPEAITIGGKTGTVVYLNDKWHPVSVEQATMARVLFDDGSTGFFMAEPVQSVAKYDPSQPRDPQGTPTGGQFTETGRAGRPESGTYLAHAAKQGIPEIEKLLPEAIKTANYSKVTVEWDDLNEAAREKVYQKFIEEHHQNAYDDLDLEELNNEFREALRNDPIRQEDLTKLTEQQFRIHQRHRIAEDSISRDLTQLKHLDGTPLTVEEKADAALLWQNLYEDQEQEAMYAIRASDAYEARREALVQQNLREDWKGTSTWDKMQLATNMRLAGELPEIEPVAQEPKQWVTGVVKGGHANNNYALTHAIAQRLTELRFEEIREQRNLDLQIPKPEYSIDEDNGKFIVVDEGTGYTVRSIGDQGAFDTKEEAKEHAEAWAVKEQADNRKTESAIIEDTWNQWKRSSSEGLSLSMQLAAAEELGGVHRLTRAEMDEAYEAAEDIGGMEVMKAYARAQWETTQFIMHKAGEENISVYRGLMLAGERVRNTTKVVVDKFGKPLDPPTNIKTIEERVESSLDTPDKPPLRTMVAFDFNGEHFVVEKEQREVKDIRDLEAFGSGKNLEDDATAIQRRIDTYVKAQQFQDMLFTQLPDITLRRAGAQSTTGTRGVANDWNGVGDLPENPIRVVLRVEAPATSILSLPVYGQNAQEEHETVLLGTTDKWLWDAWRNKAPDFASHRVGQARKSEPLLLDLQAEDRGQPHWLTNSDTLEGEHGITHKWNEAQHPRDEDGKFTVSGVRHDSVQASQPHAGAGGSGGVAVPKATRPDAVQAAHDVANAYNALHDRGTVTHDYVTVDEGGARSIAKAYEALPDDDSANPAVKEAYDALATEIQAQWDYLKAEGYTLLPWTAGAQPGSSVQAPYATSTEMAADVRDNKRLYFFTGGNPHPYIGDSTKDADGLTINDKFRAIHDVFGHAAGGYGFGARGEENAWRAHSQMFSAKARRAMTTETRGQNSWVNFGVQNYNADGTHKNVPPAERPYAKQKVALLPDRYVFP